MRTEEIQIVVTGRVQGVGFRQFTFHTATKLGLLGWVKNLENGDVEAQAWGPTEALENFLKACHQGPPLSQVTSVRILDRRPATSSKFATFSILRT